MAYRFAKERKVLWPINVVSAKDGGGTAEHPIKIQYLLISGEELEQLRQAEQAKDAPLQALTGIIAKITRLGIGGRDEETQGFLKKHVLGWEGVQDEAGNEIAFSFDNLLMVMSDLAFAKAVSNGLYEASYGAARKN